MKPKTNVKPKTQKKLNKLINNISGSGKLQKLNTDRYGLKHIRNKDLKDETIYNLGLTRTELKSLYNLLILEVDLDIMKVYKSIAEKLRLEIKKIN